MFFLEHGTHETVGTVPSVPCFPCSVKILSFFVVQFRGSSYFAVDTEALFEFEFNSDTVAREDLLSLLHEALVVLGLCHALAVGCFGIGALEGADEFLKLLDASFAFFDVGFDVGHLRLVGSDLL